MFLLAFDFLSPAMLWWLPAAALPLAIHFWTRRRFREAPWAAMEYLLRAIDSSRRRLFVEQWLLLALRTLIVLLIVLAIAEPLLEAPMFVSPGGVRTLRILVLDGSFSMAYRPGEKTRFDRAKEIAQQIVGESRDGDGFAVILASGTPRVIVAAASLDRTAVAGEIARLELPHATADFPAAMAEIETQLEAAAEHSPELIRKEVYILTDLGRVGWEVDKAQRDGLREQAATIADSARLTLIDLGQPDAENLAIAALECEERFATVGRTVDFRVQVKSYCHQPRQQRVDLYVDDSRMDQKTLDVPAGGTATATFSHQFEAAGDHRIEVRAEGDKLEVDNRRFFVLPVKERLRALCVDGRHGGGAFRGASGYLVAALTPNAAAAGAVRVETVPEGQLRFTNLRQYDCVFLVEVRQFTPDEANLLDAYLRAGGGLVLFLGPNCDVDSYRRTIGPTSDVAILPAEIGEVVRNAAQWRVDPLGYRHPMVRPFEHQEDTGLLTTPVFAWYRLRPAKGNARIALAMSNGDPLIVESPVHRGRVVLVASPAGDPSWNALPLWPSFVPLVQEMLGAAVGRQVEDRNLLVGRPLSGALGPTAPASLSVEPPGGPREEIRATTDGAAAWSYADTATSGVYSVRIGPPVDQARLFAVNVDPVESDPATIPADTFRQDVLAEAPVSIQTGFQNLDQPAAAARRPESRPAQAILAAVALLMLAETYLARRFGWGR